jgi:hypothetical protein
MRLRRVLRFRPRYADVAATLALLLATSGTAYAVTALPAHSVGAKQLKKSAVKTVKVAPRAITTSKIRPGAVTSDKLAANSVGSSNVADDSLTLSDLVGADVTGAITLPAMAGNTCITPTISVTGAAVGQVAQFSFTGATAVPPKLVVGPLMVTAADTVAGSFCNIGTTTSAVTSIGIRIITLG